MCLSWCYYPTRLFDLLANVIGIDCQHRTMGPDLVTQFTQANNGIKQKEVPFQVVPPASWGRNPLPPTTPAPASFVAK